MVSTPLNVDLYSRNGDTSKKQSDKLEAGSVGPKPAAEHYTLVVTAAVLAQVLQPKLCTTKTTALLSRHNRATNYTRLFY